MAELLTIEEVMERTTLGRSTIYANINAGTFPKPMKISKRKIRWTTEDINSWIQGLIDKRDGENNV
jgi:prophage regulatory protein